MNRIESFSFFTESPITIRDPSAGIRFQKPGRQGLDRLHRQLKMLGSRATRKVSGGSASYAGSESVTLVRSPVSFRFDDDRRPSVVRIC